MYNILLLRELDPGALQIELAAIFRISPRDVDVSDQDEMEERNWNAIVSCDFAQGSGDIPWKLSIYASGEVGARPSESVLASEIARTLNVSVLFPGALTLPSVWNVRRSDGAAGFVRIAEPESDDDVLRVILTEQDLPELPGAASGGIPEVIRELQIPSPVSDALLGRCTSGDSRRIHGLLVNWERLTVRMSSGWPPSGWYPPEMYAEDLRLRDELGVCTPEEDRDLVRGLLERLDAAYRASSVSDDGRLLCEALGSTASASLPSRAWYWLRRPLDAPWRS
ncbi:hypothetical protein [Streptomyces sp. NRRL F-2890]|uniref:hypothetical protein n=1 Tax=Streptomyces sp. NRRL F-2890 TaxID=1463845 RepID=UPI00131A5757|nr:hypothetical protein [Streptomyces sp. NRRL F-2890]